MSARGRQIVLGLIFLVFSVAAFTTIQRDGVSGSAWLWLFMASTTAMLAILAFFQGRSAHTPDALASPTPASSRTAGRATSLSTESEAGSTALPDPAEAGFDMPVL